MATSVAIWLLMLLHSSAVSGNSAPANPSPFIRVETGTVVSDGGWSFGVCWVDYDGDNYPDLFVCNDDFSSATDVNFLYRNNGDGTYTRVSEGEITTDAGGSISATWADFDADGDLDCYASRAFANQNLLYVNNGDGSFNKDTSNALVGARKFSMEVEWVDYDNDSRLDIFVVNHGRRNDSAIAHIYHNENGVFRLMKNSEIGLLDDESNGIAWGDYNGDGYRDLFWSRNNKPSLLFSNDGDGTFTQMTESVLAEPPAKYHSSWADFDNDGDLDIFTKSGDPGVVTLYKNMGKGTFEPAANPELAQDTGYWIGGYWGDYDNDGWLDLLIIGNDRYEPHRNQLYHNNGDGTFAKVKSGVIMHGEEPSSAAAWADHDRDGDLDLFIANVNNIDNALYNNLGNTNYWIQIRLEGRLSNHSGIGAKVRLRATLSDEPVWQMREISAKMGFKSQSELVAHFGLGNANIVDSLIVEWPSGAVQILTGVDVNQYLTITEP